MLTIFFILKFLFTCPLVCKPLREHALPDQTHAGFLFNLIRNPRGYQYIGTSSFPDSFNFAKSCTNPKHHRDWKTQTSSTKYWNRPHLYSILGPRIWNITSFSVCKKKKKTFVTLWMTSVFISRQPTIFSKTDPPNSYSTKTQILK